MKSNSAAPDFVPISRFEAAIDASAALDQRGDDGRIGLDRRGSDATRRLAGTLIGE